MPRPLLPPRGIHVPTTIVFHRDLSPSVIHTWIQLRALAWGQDETPQLSIPQLSELTSKSRSTIFGHMALLRQWGALRWRSSETGTLIVTFPADTVEFYLDGDFLAPESEILESKNLEKLSPSLPSLINNFDLNDVEEREREEKDLDHSRSRPVQKFGKSSITEGELQSKNPDKPVPHSLRGPRDVLEGVENEAPRSGAKSPSGGLSPSLYPVPRSAGSLINQFDLNNVEEREREDNKLDYSRGRTVQKSGKSPIADGGLQSKNPDKPVPHSLRGPRDIVEGVENEAPRSGVKSPSGGLSPSLPSLINNFDLNDVEEREREEKDLDHSRGLSPALSGEIPVQNSGLQSKKPDKPVPHSLRGPRDVLEGMDSIQDFGCVPESKNLDGGGLPAELLSPQSGGDGADPIKIYRALTGIRPNKLQREHLTAQISDTNIWYASVEHWQSHGWNPKNIAGILQLYQRGGPSACRYCPQDDESQEDSLSILERMRAELKESSNGRS